MADLGASSSLLPRKDRSLCVHRPLGEGGHVARIVADAEAVGKARMRPLDARRRGSRPRGSGQDDQDLPHEAPRRANSAPGSPRTRRAGTTSGAVLGRSRGRPCRLGAEGTPPGLGRLPREPRTRGASRVRSGLAPQTPSWQWSAWTTDPWGRSCGPTALSDQVDGRAQGPRPRRAGRDSRWMIWSGPQPFVESTRSMRRSTAPGPMDPTGGTQRRSAAPPEYV